jgi:hypothetical protein
VNSYPFHPTIALHGAGDLVDVYHRHEAVGRRRMDRSVIGAITERSL